MYRWSYLQIVGCALQPAVTLTTTAKITWFAVCNKLAVVGCGYILLLMSWVVNINNWCCCCCCMYVRSFNWFLITFKLQWTVQCGVQHVWHALYEEHSSPNSYVYICRHVCMCVVVYIVSLVRLIARLQIVAGHFCLWVVGCGIPATFLMRKNMQRVSDSCTYIYICVYALLPHIRGIRYNYNYLLYAITCVVAIVHRWYLLLFCNIFSIKIFSLLHLFVYKLPQ